MTDTPDNNKLNFIVGEIEVPEKTPFKYDAQDRKPFCEEIKVFIDNAPTPYVLALDSGWGNGKSVFLKMLKAHLINNDFPCVYFDAWKSDFHSDPLPAMMITIKMELGKLCEKNPPDKSEKIIEKLVKISAKAEVVLLAAAKQQLGKHFGIQVANAIFSKDSKPIESNITSDYEKYLNAIEELKSELKELAEEKKPLVFMVDELDRCRPSYSLEVLEKIKHVFDVKNVFFIVALNQEEMGKTAKVVYGDINTEIYFRKFFNRTIRFGNNKGMMYTLLEKTGISLMKEVDQRFSVKGADIFTTLFGLSLRDAEQLASAMAHIMGTRNLPLKNDYGIMFAAFFLALKLANKPLFDEFVSFSKIQDLPIKKLEEWLVHKTKTKTIYDMYQQLSEQKKVKGYEDHVHLILCIFRILLNHELTRENKETLTMENLPQRTQNLISYIKRDNGRMRGIDHQFLKDILQRCQ